MEYQAKCSFVKVLYHDLRRYYYSKYLLHITVQVCKKKNVH
jgi:hypothetical protein